MHICVYTVCGAIACLCGYARLLGWTLSTVLETYTVYYQSIIHSSIPLIDNDIG